MSVRVVLLLSLLRLAVAGEATMEPIDYVLAAQREEWLRHSTLGDPSCDAFERLGGPVLSGTPGLEWPVNGSLLVDPKDGAWYLYAGRYPKDYALQPPPNHMQCAMYRSRDRGGKWESIGTPWPEAEFRLEGVASSVTHSPDMAVTAREGSRPTG